MKITDPSTIRDAYISTWTEKEGPEGYEDTFLCGEITATSYGGQRISFPVRCEIPIENWEHVTQQLHKQTVKKYSGQNLTNKPADNRKAPNIIV